MVTARAYRPGNPRKPPVNGNRMVAFWKAAWQTVPWHLSPPQGYGKPASKGDTPLQVHSRQALPGAPSKILKNPPGTFPGLPSVARWQFWLDSRKSEARSVREELSSVLGVAVVLHRSRGSNFAPHSSNFSGKISLATFSPQDKASIPSLRRDFQKGRLSWRGHG